MRTSDFIKTPWGDCAIENGGSLFLRIRLLTREISGNKANDSSFLIELVHVTDLSSEAAMSVACGWWETLDDGAEKVT